MLTAWRLTDPMGRPAQCVISERDGRWHLVVREGESIVFAERCQMDNDALDRATDARYAAHLLLPQGGRHCCRPANLERAFDV
jgi:hypothetical protein